MARTATASACVPALPPIEATIGIRIASATSWLIEPSNVLITAEATTAVPRFTSSHGARARTERKTLSVCAASLTPASLQQVFLAFFADDVDDVVDGDHAGEAPGFVDDRRGGHVIFLEGLRDLFLVHLRADQDERRAHDVAERRFARARDKA